MKYLGYAAAIVAFLAAQFWGVPYYIRYVVSEEMKANSESAQQPQEITELLTKMDAVDGHIVRLDGSVVRVERKVDDFSRLFTGYLERQASQ